MSGEMLIDDGTRGAMLSVDGRYRYDLWRRWGDGPLLGWIMLNPSIADADRDDHTVRQCMTFARREGFAGIVVRNLFAYRTTYPRELRTVDDAVGPENDVWLYQLAEDRFQKVVAAWGACNLGRQMTRMAGDRIQFIHNLFGYRLLALHVTGRATGGPAAPHPARLAHDTPLRRYAVRS